MVWPEWRLDDPPTVEPPAGYSLRTYRPGDETCFYQIMELAGWHGWDDEKLTPRLVRIPPRSWFMAVHDASNQVVATAMGLHDHTPQHPFGGEVGWVAADPAHSGRGLGRLVAGAVTTRLIAAGYRAIHLYTEPHRLAALKSYFKLGFLPFLSRPEVLDTWRSICLQLDWTFEPELWRRVRPGLPNWEQLL